MGCITKHNTLLKKYANSSQKLWLALLSIILCVKITQTHHKKNMACIAKQNTLLKKYTNSSQKM
jgi:hypothetical protein